MVNELAFRLVRARRLLGESQLAFAKRLQVSQPTVSSLEHGSMPKLPLYMRLLPILDEIERNEIERRDAATDSISA